MKFFFGGATARGGSWPPLQYACKPLDPLLYLSIRLFPSFSGTWTCHPTISFLVFLFISYLHHLFWLQHGLNVPGAKCQIRSPLSSSGIHYVPRLIVTIVFFYWVSLLASRSTPNLEDQGNPLSSGTSPSTCPARVALPVANATAGIALRIIWPRKPSHPTLDFHKVEIPWRGICMNFFFIQCPTCP